MQPLHTADQPVLAVPPVAPRRLRSILSTLTIHIASMVLGMPFDIGPGMALDTAAGVGMGRDIGVGPAAYLLPAGYRNSIADIRSLLRFGLNKSSTPLPSLEFQKVCM